jgi:hypothetical protein
MAPSEFIVPFAFLKPLFSVEMRIDGADFEAGKLFANPGLKRVQFRFRADEMVRVEINQVLIAQGVEPFQPAGQFHLPHIVQGAIGGIAMLHRTIGSQIQDVVLQFCAFLGVHGCYR